MVKKGPNLVNVVCERPLGCKIRSLKPHQVFYFTISFYVNKSVQLLRANGGPLRPCHSSMQLTLGVKLEITVVPALVVI